MWKAFILLILSIILFIGIEPECSGLHCLTNDYRASKNLKRLYYSEEATAVAKKRAEYLCDTDTFSHDNWLSFVDFNYSKVGENLAQGYKTDSDTLQALLSSKSHREAIEGDYTHIGVYTEPCGGINYTTQTFAKL